MFQGLYTHMFSYCPSIHPWTQTTQFAQWLIEPPNSLYWYLFSTIYFNMIMKLHRIHNSCLWLWNDIRYIILKCHNAYDFEVTYLGTFCPGNYGLQLVWLFHQLLSGFLVKGHALSVRSDPVCRLMIDVIMRWYRGLCTDLLAFTLRLWKTPTISARRPSDEDFFDQSPP